MEHSSKKESARIRALMKKRKKKDREIEEIVQFVHSTGGMDYAKEIMYNYANKAIEALEKVPQSPHTQSFVDLIHFIITRRK